MAGCIVAGVLTLLYTLFLCWQWKNIAIGASIMEAAGDFVSSNSRIALLPIFAYLACLPVVFWFALTNLFLYSMGEPEYIPGNMFA